VYTIPAALATIDNNIVWVLFFSACGWISGSIQFFEGLRLTYRDKVVGLPLGYLCIILAHDSYFFLNYDFWFNQVNHWYFNATTWLFAFWPVIEIVAIVWLVRVARREIAPQLAPAAWYGVYALYQVTAIALYWLLQSWIDDPLRITGWTIAQVINILFMIPMALRRRSTRGQSRLMAWTLLLGPASSTMFLATSIVPSLLTPLYYAATACITAMSVAYLLIFEYYRRQEKAGLAAVSI
jgi:hypothetical protein